MPSFAPRPPRRTRWRRRPRRAIESRRADAPARLEPATELVTRKKPFSRCLTPPDRYSDIWFTRPVSDGEDDTNAIFIVGNLLSFTGHQGKRRRYRQPGDYRRRSVDGPARDRASPLAGGMRSRTRKTGRGCYATSSNSPGRVCSRRSDRPGRRCRYPRPKDRSCYPTSCGLRSARSCRC